MFPRLESDIATGRQRLLDVMVCDFFLLGRGCVCMWLTGARRLVVGARRRLLRLRRH